ncbi:MAG: hypothetical protein WBF81_08120 [Thermoplasmata archaeon]
MYGASANAAPPPAPGSNDPAVRTQRYNYLTSRLRNRQLTMEEATELFALMQAMLARANELARVAAYRSAASATPAASPSTPSAPRPLAASSSSDDLLLVGILAMGAGAGLLAALSQRMGNPPPPPSPPNPRSNASTNSR